MGRFAAMMMNALSYNIFNGNTLRPRQDGRHFPDDILKCIFLNENVWISLTISPKCVGKVRINNIPSLVQIMAWRRPGDKPLSEPMMVSLLAHMRHSASTSYTTNLGACIWSCWWPYEIFSFWCIFITRCITVLIEIYRPSEIFPWFYSICMGWIYDNIALLMDVLLESLK